MTQQLKWQDMLTVVQHAHPDDGEAYWQVFHASGGEVVGYIYAQEGQLVFDCQFSMCYTWEVFAAIALLMEKIERLECKMINHPFNNPPDVDQSNIILAT